MSAVDDEDITLGHEHPQLGPRARRESDLDGVHNVIRGDHEVAPAQLYSTESGHLYHAGKICIVLVGLPARGKTHHAVSLTRYLRWLGVKSHAFHLGDYRRKVAPADFRVPDDYFMPDAAPETVKLRQKVIQACRDDLFRFFDEDGGQVAIYDAVNATAAGRRRWARELEARNISPMFVECLITNEALLARNIRDVKLMSPDYQHMDPDEAVRHYLRRIELRIPHYETMAEQELTYVKLINVNERFIVNHGGLGYLRNRIMFFLMNSRIKVGSVFFARAGAPSDPKQDHRMDSDLSPDGRAYAEHLKATLWAHIEKRFQQRQQAQLDDVDRKTLRKVRDTHYIGDITPPVTDGTSTPHSPADARAVSTIRADALNFSDKSKLSVWCSTRRRTAQTAETFAREGIRIHQRSQLNVINSGDATGLSDAELKEKYPEEYERHQHDPYHHRYPRAESYQDLALRLEPLILEMERIPNDLLIIAHESVLRVLYGYLMASSTSDIPFLEFPPNEIVEIIPNAYVNQVNRIPVQGVQMSPR